MFLVWVVYGTWMYKCIGKVSCIRCVLIRYTALIITLMVVSALL